MLQLAGNISGDRIAELLRYDAIDGVPDYLNSLALWRALQQRQSINPAWCISKQRTHVSGGTGIPCTIPGQTARMDGVGPIYINGYAIYLLIIMDEATMLVIIYILSKKKTSAMAVKLYQDGVCRPAGHQLLYIRIDPDSVMGQAWVEAINNSLPTPLTILSPLSREVMAEHQRGAGIAVNKTATEQHERMVERTIQVLQDDAINLSISQGNVIDRTCVSTLCNSKCGIVDGGASGHVMINSLAQQLWVEGLITEIEIHAKGDITIAWGEGSAVVIGIAKSQGLLDIVYIVDNMGTELLISEYCLCEKNIIFVKNSDCLIGLQHGIMVMYATASPLHPGENSLWLCDIRSLFKVKPIHHPSPTSTPIVQNI